MTWMMLNYPQIFEKYIMPSPSLWIEKGQMMTQFRRLNHSEKVKAYFAVGSLEQDTKGSMVNALELFYTALPKSKLFESKFQIIESENHVSIVPEGFDKRLKVFIWKIRCFHLTLLKKLN